MRRLALIACLLAGGVYADEPQDTGARIYQKTGPKGEPVFTDQPSPEARQVTLPSTNVATPAEVRAAPPPTPEAPAARYERLTITSPQNDGTAEDGTGDVQVEAALAPALQVGHQVRLRVDGSVHGRPGTGLSWQLRNMDRGSHTLQVEVLDQDGRVVIRSKAVTVHVFRPVAGKQSHDHRQKVWAAWQAYVDDPKKNPYPFTPGALDEKPKPTPEPTTPTPAPAPPQGDTP